jgi:tetratricopeptide (TPR) repeat protein
MQGSTRIDELRQKFHENPRRYFAPLANEYRKAGDPEQAIAICRAHLAQQPGHMSGHVVYGQALYDAKRPDEARAVFEKALALDPDNAIVLRQLGDIAREKGDTSEARHWYSRALDADPNDRESAAYVAELTEPSTEEPVPDAVTSSADDSGSVSSEAIHEEPKAAPEQELAAPEPSREPEVLPALEPLPSHERASEEPAPLSPGESAPLAVDEDIGWRKTPPHEESPFVTRTMAELYASQGYRQAALDVYRQLALQHPDDMEISSRIEALEKDEESEPPATAPQAAASEEMPAVAEIPFEPMISDMPVEPGPDTAADVSTESEFAPSSEDLNLTVPATTSSRPTPHFTENELSTGDTWDTDSWGAGFSSDEDLNLDFDSPDVPGADTTAVAETSHEPEPEPYAEPQPSAEAEPSVAAETGLQAEPATHAEPETAPDREFAAMELAPLVDAPETPAQAETNLDLAEAQSNESQLVEEIQPEEQIAEPELSLSEPEAEDLVEEPVEERPEEPIAVADEGSYESEQEPEDASHVVAYSPQLPEEEDLPHYAPKGPTVREFFAALGAFRPSAKPGSSITAHGAIPSPQAEQASAEFPLASDAFASLFSDSSVSDEDSRAAFALSGALGASAPTSAAITAPQEPQPPADVASPASTQESEEDIRRFREWLDGLQDS